MAEDNKEITLGVKDLSSMSFALEQLSELDSLDKIKEKEFKVERIKKNSNKEKGFFAKLFARLK